MGCPRRGRLLLECQEDFSRRIDEEERMLLMETEGLSREFLRTVNGDGVSWKGSQFRIKRPK